MRKLTQVVSLIVLLALLLSACAPASQPKADAQEPAAQPEKEQVLPQEKKEPVTLRFTYWGSPVEKEAVAKVLTSFEEQNPDIKVEPIYIPQEYEAKLAAMVAGKEAPDIAYVGDPMIHSWGQEGRWMNLFPLYHDGTLKEPLRDDYMFFWAPGEALGSAACGEMPLMFYNKAVFDEAGLPYPPSDPDKAWTWNEFVEVARQLTTDVNGKHPGESGFDPENIDVYGANISKWWGIYFAFLHSNNTNFANEDGTKSLLDSPEAIEVYQSIADLSNVEYVAPTPAQSQNLPGGSTLLQTGKLAMSLEGQWMLLDFNKMKDEGTLDFGIGVLPKFQKPATIMYCMPIGISATTQHKEEALKLYKFLMDPEYNNLYEVGLWMPIYKEYYTDEDKIKSWIDNPAHPPEYKDIVEYAACCSHSGPLFFWKGFPTLMAEIVEPKLDQLWSGERSAEEVLTEIAAEVNPKLTGRWDK